MTTTLQRTQVDLSGLMRVLGEALYSTPSVVIRELVQNAHDACRRRQVEYGDDFAPKIEVAIESGELVISDNGAGLTEPEIHEFLATVGKGYTRHLRDQGTDDGLIGYFGLGFLSAFAVSEKVEVLTCSAATPALTHRYASRTGLSYSVDRAPDQRPNQQPDQRIGTQVRLTLKAEHESLSDPENVRLWLHRYACLLAFPVNFRNDAPVNSVIPPWRSSEVLSTLRFKTLSLDFVKRFDRVFEPIAAIAIIDAQGRACGLLWLHDQATYGNNDNRNLAVFVRGMLIGNDERELLPQWAGFVSGILESDALLPTASRESLRKDQGYIGAAIAIRESLITGLIELAKNDPEAWQRVLRRHNQALLGACLVDERLFDALHTELTVPTSEGDMKGSKLMQLPSGQLHLSMADEIGVESVLLRALKVPVIQGYRYAAALFAQRLAQKHGLKLVTLGTEQGDGQMFLPSNLPQEAEHLLQQRFGKPDREVCVRAFEPSCLPLALVVNREVALKRALEDDSADQRISQAVLGLARVFTRSIAAKALSRLYINTRNPAIQTLLGATEAVQIQIAALLGPILQCAADQSENELSAALDGFSQAIVTVFGQVKGEL